MTTWLESIYSDGTSAFVSSPSPDVGQTVAVRMRILENAPVEHVLLRSLHNGVEHLEEMHPVKKERGLTYYEAPMSITENRIGYHFYILTRDTVYFYTQRGITTYIPDNTHDFAVLANYHQPEWVKHAVFYHIFPERFCNGDPGNDVQTGEYAFEGHQALHIEPWETPSLPYQQGYCMDFHGGDLQGVEQKIPYLKKLGVTAVYLNPIFDAPSVHKYDCIDYFHVDPHFGGDEALASLSKALHDNDMKLILDISINHTGTAHKWFNRDNIFFDASVGAFHNPDLPERSYYFFDEENHYHGWLGHQNLPTLNYTSEALRDAVYRAEDSVLKKWLKPPYCIDGWRFDVAEVFARNDRYQLADELWPQISRSIREENPDAYILAEDWGDCAARLQGDQWDSPMNYFGCARVIRQFLGEPDLFLSRNPLVRSVPYQMTASDVKNRVLDHLSRMPYVMWENQFNLLDSHDVPRLHNNPRVNPQEYRGAVYFMFLLTGAAVIYYGDEAGIDGGTETMEDCRYPMPWSRDIEHTDAFRLYSRMCALKAAHKALSLGGMKFLYAEGRTVAIARFWEDEVFVGVISGESDETEITLPLQILGAAAPAGQEDLFGASLAYHTDSDGNTHLTVPAHQAYFFRCDMIPQ